MHSLATSSADFAGTDVRAAARIALGETPEMPVLPALADRGIGADPTGRTAALLVDLPVDTSPRAWRLSANSSRSGRRAAGFLDRDLDALEEQFELARGTVVDGGQALPVRGIRIEVCGPWTLAARLELPGGRAALSDPGARRDLAQSLLAGLSALARRMHARVGVPVRWILNETLLWNIAAGSVPAPSEFDPIPAIPAERLSTALSRFASTLRAAPTEGVFASAPGRGTASAPAQWDVFTVPPAGERRLDGIVLDAPELLPWSGGEPEHSQHGWADGDRDPQAFALLDVLGTFVADGGRAEIHRPHLLQGQTHRAPETMSEAESAAAAVVRIIDTLRLERPRAVDALTVAAGAADLARDGTYVGGELAAVRRIADVLPRVAS